MFQFKRLVGIAVLFAIAFAAAPTTALAQTSVPVEWKVSDGGNGHWYAETIDSLVWTEMRTACQAKGGHLATLTSQAEWNWVKTQLPIPYYEGRFVGGYQDHTASTYAEPNGGWRWVTGEPFIINLAYMGSTTIFGKMIEPGFDDCPAGTVGYCGCGPDGAQDVLFFTGCCNNILDDVGDGLVQNCDSVARRSIIEWSADCNGDGIVDYGQILGGALADANGNNVPDCCESQTWATVLEFVPNPAVVTDANLRAAIAATNLPWRVLDKGTNIEMLLVPGGTFTMGCSASSNYSCDSNENPTHQVTLSKAFYLGKTEVTQAQWTAKMLSNPSYFSGNPNNPVERVSWNDIAGFNTATGLRLPSEAEWEYACRGGTTTAFHSMPGYPNGTNVDSLLGNIAWCSDNSGSTSHAVAGKAANAFGMYDMSGNVWEWCNDWFGNYAASNATDPTGPSTGSSRVLRGGDWWFYSYDCRSSCRNRDVPDDRTRYLGFRAARTPAPSNVLNVPSQFATIQSAINAAPTSGWTIQVAPGTYNEAIDFKGKAITVKATGARASTIIDGTGLTTSVVRAVTGETSATVLQGFTIRNGAVGSKPPWDTTLLLGGGLYIERANPIIRDCAFTTNHSAYGGGIYALYSNSLVENCTFTQNSASSYGGGIQFFGGSPIIRNCVITNNTCLNRGGGIHLVQWNVGASTLDGCTITGNSTNLGEGGGVSLDPQANAAQKMLVSNCTITNNTAHDKGGGLWATVNPANPKQNVMLNDNTICNNTSVISKRENVWALFEDGGNTICDCLPDVSGDGDVDTGDVSYVLLFFGEPTDADFIQPDQDMSGLIDTADVSLVLLNMGACP